MATKPAQRVTASDLEALIRARYPANEYAMFLNVPDSTGARERRRADAVAINLWPSRGLELEGFEIKVDRRDWLRELKDPAKADVVCRYCHRWWIVAPEGVVADGELPKTWGLLVPGRKGLKVVVVAPALTPDPPTLAFFASLCRAAQATLTDNAQIDEAYQRGRREGHDSAYKLGKEHAEYSSRRTLDSLTRERDDARATITEFTEAVGIGIHKVNAAAIGRAVRLVLDGDMPRYATQLEQMRGTLATALTYVERQAAEARAIVADSDREQIR